MMPEKFVFSPFDHFGDNCNPLISSVSG